MKKALPFLLLQSLFATVCIAQNLIAKVPANASLVLKYSGGSLSQKLPAAKFDSYTTLKKKLFEELKMGPTATLDDMGIDLGQDSYQYLTLTDTTTNFVTLAYIKNSDKFAQFIKKKNKKNIPFETKAGFQLYPVSQSVYLGWNGKVVSLVVLSYTDNSYYYATAAVDTTKPFSELGKTTPYSDSSVVLEEVKPTTDSIIKVETIPAPVEGMAVDSTRIDTAPIIDSAVQNPEDAKREEEERIEREKFYKEKDIKDSIIQKGLAENILLAVYDSTIASIESNASFNKLVDKTADINIWTNTLGLFNRFYPYHYRHYGPYSPYANTFNFNSWLGYTQAVNVFFEDKRVRVEQRLTSVNDSSMQLFKNIMNSRQNISFVNYLHSSDLGYLSVSLNTEAMINYYYPLVKSILSSIPYTKNYSELIDAYVDIMQIVIDEKGIADMVPGNALFVLHSLKQKEVKYISYDYDDKNFNYKQIEKTKTEMSPDFSFIFETKNEKIFNKLINLPVKLGKENKFDYVKTGDYYTLTLGKDNILDKLYFMVKDGKCIITTSLQDVSNPATSDINPAIKQSILNSNYSGRFNIKSLVKSLSTEVTDKKNKKMISYLQDNVDDATFESTLKDDVIVTTAILNIDGTHKNSFEYFFNVINRLLELDTSVK